VLVKIGHFNSVILGCSSFFRCIECGFLPVMFCLPLIISQLLDGRCFPSYAAANITVYKITNYFNFQCSSLKHIKKEQQNHKISGICVLVYVKLTHQSGSMAVAAILREVLRCLIETSNEILLFLCFILQSSCISCPLS